MLLFLALACQPDAEPAGPGSEPDPIIPPIATVVTGVEGARLARLSHVQWQNTVEDLLHLGDTDDLTEHFVDSAIPSWFENDRDTHEVDPTLWLQYQAAAEELSAQVAADPELFDKVVPVRERDTFILTFGKRAFRRPLTQKELEAYTALFDGGAAIFGSGDPFVDGAHAVIAAMLQSPYFLYQSLGYLGPGEGTELDDYELASKLSYSLWNTMPDTELFAAAEAGLTPDVLAQQARRMLQDERSAAMVRDLHRQWLDIDRYINIWRTDEERYDDYLLSTPYAMTLEVYAYVDRVAYGGGTVEDLFSSRETLVEDRLAATYGVEGVKGHDNASMVQVSLDPSERAGLFTLSGFLALQSDGATEDLIHRGAYLNHAVLCVDVPSPGQAVPPLPVDGTEDLTLRELVDEHTSTCGAGCHTDYINPVGFALANYDAYGAYQVIDNGKTIDSSGTYAFDSGERSWSDGVEFLEGLAVDPQVHRCYVEHLLTYAEGRRMGPSDDARVDAYMEKSLDGEPIIELIYGIVTDPDYRLRP